MSGRTSRQAWLAVRAVGRGSTVLAAAARHRLAPSTVRRALRRAGVAPLRAGRPRKTSIILAGDALGDGGHIPDGATPAEGARAGEVGHPGEPILP